MSDTEQQEVDIFCAPGEIRQEAKREYDPTIIKSDDEDLILENETDPLEDVISGKIEPKVKITTSGDDAPLIPFGECLQKLIPNSLFERRDEAATFKYIHDKAIEEGYTDLLVLCSANNEVYSMTHIHLPYGPTADWRVMSIALPKDIPGHAKTSEHYPEVQLHRFVTRLGKLCGRMLRALFPANPEYHGRRVITLHHQRDFVFFRHYRYIFDSTEAARLQEAGPKFTLKLNWLQEGPYDPMNGMYTFIRKGRHEESRRRWWM